jgi:cytochrome c2
MKKVMIAFAALSMLAAAPAFADGDVKKGKKAFKKCKVCHAVGDGAKSKVGPPLNNIFGKTAGTHEGFKYSKVMIAKGGEGLVWNDETMAEFIKSPKRYMKGTKMSFVGFLKKKDMEKEKKVKKADKKIEDLLAYLKTFSPDAE